MSALNHSLIRYEPLLFVESLFCLLCSEHRKQFNKPLNALCSHSPLAPKFTVHLFASAETNSRISDQRQNTVAFLNFPFFSPLSLGTAQFRSILTIIRVRLVRVYVSVGYFMLLCSILGISFASFCVRCPKAELYVTHLAALVRVHDINWLYLNL